MTQPYSGGTLTLGVFDEASGWTLPERYVSRLAQRAGDAWKVRQVGSRSQLVEAMGETTGLIGLPLTEEQIRQHTGRLRWIQLTRSAGDASPAIEAALEGGARVTSAATPRAPQVAEHAMALTLAMLRKIDVAIAKQRAHEWSARELAPQVRTLAGTSVGVIGAPPLVRALAALATPFGATVTGCLVGEQGVERDVEDVIRSAHAIGDLHGVLSGSDVVIVGTPRLESTMRLISKKSINAMKHNALLVDVSRGGIVDHNALVDALRKGRIAGAALDVFVSEPLPPTSPLWTMESVLMTPHIGAAGDGFWDRLIDHAGENARRITAGQPLIDEMTPALYLSA